RCGESGKAYAAREAARRDSSRVDTGNGGRPNRCAQARLTATQAPALNRDEVPVHALERRRDGSARRGKQPWGTQAPDERQQVVSVNRFLQGRGRAQRTALESVERAREGRDEDHRDGRKARVLELPGTELDAAHPRHHEVEQNQGRLRRA